MKNIIIPGDPRNSPRKAYFDLSVYVSLNPQKTALISTKTSEENIHVYDSPVGIVETIAKYVEASDKGESTQRFISAMEKEKVITGVNIFPTPSTFVRSHFPNTITKNDYLEENALFDKLRQKFLVDESTRLEFLSDTHLRTQIQKRHDFADAYATIMKTYASVARNQLGKDGTLRNREFLRELLLKTCTHFQLSENERNNLIADWLSGKEIPKYRALKVFILFQIRKVGQYVTGKKPDPGDFLDLDHIIYSTAVDYFVTNEGRRGYRRILIDSLREMKRNCQVLNIDEFCSQILGV